MASRKLTSKKHSASNSDSLPDAAALLLIDRCAWSRKLGEALNQAGIQFVAHHEIFAPACPDEEWMKVAGQKGWIVLTRDQAIRRKPNELKAFREAKLIMFALASGNASAEDTARLVVALYPRILRKARSSKPPAMFSVTLAGGINPVR
jgi:hypothetical protein